MKLSQMFKAALRPVVGFEVFDGYIGVSFLRGAARVQLDRQGRSVRVSRKCYAVAEVTLGADVRDEDGQYVAYSAKLGDRGVSLKAREHAVTLCRDSYSYDRWAMSVADTRRGRHEFQWSGPTVERSVGDLNFRYTSVADNQAAHAAWKAEQAKKKAEADPAAEMPS